MASFVDSIEYKLENIPATAVASDEIDKTFRSSSIGATHPHEPSRLKILTNTCY